MFCPIVLKYYTVQRRMNSYTIILSLYSTILVDTCLKDLYTLYSCGTYYRAAAAAGWFYREESECKYFHSMLLILFQC